MWKRERKWLACRLFDDGTVFGWDGVKLGVVKVGKVVVVVVVVVVMVMVEGRSCVCVCVCAVPGGG